MNMLTALILSFSVAFQAPMAQEAEGPPAPAPVPPVADDTPLVDDSEVLPEAGEDLVEGAGMVEEAVLVGEDPAVTEAAAEAPAAAPDPRRERAEKILERAAVYQRGDVPRPDPTGLYGRFFVKITTDQGRTTANSERWFMRSPQRMVAVIEPSLGDESITEGWDDGVAWFQDSSGRVVLYSEAPENYQADLERLEELVRLHELFLDAAVLDAFIPRLQDASYAGEAIHRDIDGVPHPVEFVQAFVDDTLWVEPQPAPLFLLPGEEPPEDDAPVPRLELRFAIDAETGALWGMRVLAGDRPEVPDLDLRFDLHGETADGLRVPGNIVVRQSRGGGPSSELAKLGIEVDDEGHLAFAVDVDLPAERFAPPR